MSADTIDGGPIHRAVPGLARAARAGRLGRREFLARATALGLTTPAAYGLLGLAAPPVRAQDDGRPGGTLRIAMAVMPVEDPRLFAWSQMANVARHFVEPLVRYTPAFTFEPWLLESWEINDHATEYLLRLRREAVWTNGDAFTVEDVLANLRRWAEAHVPGNSMAGRIPGLVEPRGMEAVETEDDVTLREAFGLREDAVEAIDEHTLRIVLPQPDVSLIPSLADYPALIVHRSFDATGASLAAAPLGTGPWMLEALDVGQRALLRRRDDGRAWWGDAVIGPVHLDGIEYLDYGVDPFAQIEAFETGVIDTNYESPATYVAELDRLGLVKADVLTANTIVVRMNVAHAPYGDVRIRRAVQLAVDNAVVLDLGYQGLGLVAENHHVGPMHPEYAELPPPVFDPAAARALLEEAGAAGTDFELVSLDDEAVRDTCDATAAQLRDAGFRVTRTVLPAPIFWSRWLDFPFSATEWNMRPLGVQTYQLAYRTGATWNETGFSDARFDALLDDALGRVDEDARRALMAEMQALLRASGVIVQPFWRNIYRHMTAEVRGLVMHPTYELQLERVWLDA